MKLTMKGSPVTGDSKVKGYEGQIELTSLSWGVSIKDKTAAKDSSESEQDKNWEAKELKLSKYFDGASPVLYGQVDERQGLRTGSKPSADKLIKDNVATISMVAVSARADGESMPVLMRVTLKGCRIKSISTKADESGSSLRIGEDFRLSYLDFNIEYFPPAEKGKRGAATQFSLAHKV